MSTLDELSRMRAMYAFHVPCVCVCVFSDECPGRLPWRKVQHLSPRWLLTDVCPWTNCIGCPPWMGALDVCPGWAPWVNWMGALGELEGCPGWVLWMGCPGWVPWMRVP